MNEIYKRKLCYIQFAAILYTLFVITIPAYAAKHALLIGVHDYEHGPNSVFSNLNTEGDVTAIRQSLVDKFGFADTDITVLTSKSDTTRESILSHFRKVLIDNTKSGDIVYFHYSGHGSQIPDKNDPKELDQTLVPSDWTLDGTMDIRDKELNQLISEVTAKSPASFILSFDSCHSGTITRSGRMLVRGVSYEKRFGKPAPEGNTFSIRGGRMLIRDKDLSPDESVKGYSVISACRDDQSAVETEDDNHQAIGRLSYLLAKAFDQADDSSTVRDIFEKVNAQMLEHYPGQNPQMEGTADKAVFNGAAIKAKPYFSIYVNGGKDVILKAGSLHGITAGSQFELYKSGAKDFTSSSKICDSAVSQVGLTESRLHINGNLLNIDSLSASRAIETVHQYGDNRLKIDPKDIGLLPNSSKVLALLKSVSIIDTEIASGEKPDIRIVSDGAKYNIIREDGGSVIASVTDNPDLPETMRDILSKEAKYRFVRSLNNENPNSPIQIEMRLTPAEVSGDQNLGITWKADKGAVASGSTLYDGQYVTVEVRNTGDEDAYVAVLDLQSNGTVNQLWPDPSSPITTNVIPHGNPNKWYKLWDGKQTNPWPIQLGEPYGTEIIKAIATREHVDFNTLRGQSKPASPLDTLLKAAVAGTRAKPAVRPSAWATSTFVVNIQPKQ